jgi:hypothetical protein
MMPSQTADVLSGSVVALLYATAVMTAGLIPLAAFLGQRALVSIRTHLGLVGFVWLGFVMGQGLLAVVWLAIGLAGALYAWLIWIVVMGGAGTACGLLFLRRSRVEQAARAAWSSLWSRLRGRSWYVWMGIAIGMIGVLGVMTAVLPPENDDALRWYLPVAKATATAHKVALQPFVTPHSALYPLQVEMHWAALFAISNETAVTVWDYLCAWSFLIGVALLGWSLTANRRVALFAAVMMLSTPGFFDLMGSGKVDNAASQYGIGAFLWLVLWPALGRRAVMLAGLYLGWAVASRYTNVIVLPALIVFALMLKYRFQKGFVAKKAPTAAGPSLPLQAAAGGSVAVCAVAPMLIKNWLLVGCPLAPLMGCQDKFWAGVLGGSWNNISRADLLFYPFVWTFATIPDSYGNISPLFLGFTAFLLAYHRSPIIRSGLIAGVSGLASLATWLLIKPFILYTRWLLIPLGLLTVPLSAAVVAVEQDPRHNGAIRWLIRTSIVIISFFLLFQSRAAVYGVRYLAGIDTRVARYATKPGYEVAGWLNAHVQPGQRVALNESILPRYFVRPDILWHSESSVELQWLWEHRGRLAPADFWQFHAEHAFNYVVIAKDRTNSATTAWLVWPRVHNVLTALPHDRKIEVAFEGGQDTVLRIAQP